jgi:hypothetical protein
MEFEPALVKDGLSGKEQAKKETAVNNEAQILSQ